MELPPALSIIFFDMYRPRNIKRTIGSTQYISRDTHGEVCRCISPENFALGFIQSFRQFIIIYHAGLIYDVLVFFICKYDFVSSCLP